MKAAISVVMLQVGISCADWPVLQVTVDAAHQSVPHANGALVVYADYTGKTLDDLPNLRWADLNLGTGGYVVNRAGGDEGIPKSIPVVGVGSRSVTDGQKVLYAETIWDVNDPNGFAYLYGIYEREAAGGVVTVWYVQTNENELSTLLPVWAGTGIVFCSEHEGQRHVYWQGKPGGSLRRLSGITHIVNTDPATEGRVAVWEGAANVGATLARHIVGAEVVTGGMYTIEALGTAQEQYGVSISTVGVAWVRKEGGLYSVRFRSGGGTVNTSVYTSAQSLRGGRLWNQWWIGLEGGSGGTQEVLAVNVQTGRRVNIGVVAPPLNSPY
ncbi:MAG: hypothetical protein N2595_10925, partial [bacterium]|nr:hypothetical protein [bacterium]